MHLIQCANQGLDVTSIYCIIWQTFFTFPKQRLVQFADSTMIITKLDKMFAMFENDIWVICWQEIVLEWLFNGNEHPIVAQW